MGIDLHVVRTGPAKAARVAEIAGRRAAEARPEADRLADARWERERITKEICHPPDAAVPPTDTDRTTEAPWNLRERLGEARIQAIIDARLDGANLVQLTNTFGVSLSSIKRLFRTARSAGREKDFRGPQPGESGQRTAVGSQLIHRSGDSFSALSRRRFEDIEHRIHESLELATPLRGYLAWIALSKIIHNLQSAYRLESVFSYQTLIVSLFP